MNKESDWKEMEALGRKGCGSVWPKIVQLRAELHTYESVHGYFEAMLIEAQRHLIKLPLDEEKFPEKKKIDRLVRSFKGLSEVSQKRLEEILERTYEK